MERYRLPAARRTFQRAARIITPSTWDAKNFDLLELNPAPPIDVIPHGLGTAWIDGALRTNNATGSLRVLFVGDWSYTKGGDRVPAVINALNAAGVPTELTVVTGDATDFVRSSFGSTQLSLTVLGGMASTEMRSLMANHDVILIPSRYESFGRVTVEAMAVGLLVATARTGCALDLVVDGENGILVDFDSPAAVAGRIGDCLRQMDRIGQRAQRSVRQLTWEYVAGRTAKVYERALGQGEP
jgi:glycosyltransferase involved in cell wall biosynthesis